MEYGIINMADEPMVDGHPAGNLLEIDLTDSDSAVCDVDAMLVFCFLPKFPLSLVSPPFAFPFGTSPQSHDTTVAND